MSILLYLFTILMLLRIHLPWIALVFICSYLCIRLLLILRQKAPHPIYHQLRYLSNAWYLETATNAPLKFERMRIAMDAAFCLLIVLSEGQRHKKLILFTDQLSEIQLRTLRILAKLQR